MSDMMNLMEKIPYAVILLFGTILIVQIHITGSLSLEMTIDDTQKNDYRKSIVLENLLSIDANHSELENVNGAYDYDRKRAIIPVEYFTNKDPSKNSVGYERSSLGHCYIERVSGLDGQNFGFYVTFDGVQESVIEAYNPSSGKSVLPPDCAQQILGNSQVFRGLSYNSVYSEVLLVGKSIDGKVPATVYVYEIS